MRNWLELARPVWDRVMKEIPDDDPEARAWMMEQANVAEQLKHLMVYPYIYEKVISKQLMLSGWHYIIETGEVYIYDRNAGQFLLANG